MRGDALTVSADLSNAHVFLLPAEGEEGMDRREQSPRRIKWNHVAAVSEGARIFVGGRVRSDAGRARFASDKGCPLLVILFDGQDRSLLTRAVRAGRQKNEYWNPATPFALTAGAFCQLLMALSFVNRPALSAAFSAALTLAFAPILPYLPPGLLLTAASRAAWRRGRNYRALRDLVRLPLLHLAPGETETTLPDGSRYGVVVLNEKEFERIPEDAPRLPPEATRAAAGGRWYCYGAVGGEMPFDATKDPSAVYAALPAPPERLAAGYSGRAKLMETAAGAAMLGGTLLNAMLAFRLLQSLM